MVEIVGLQRLGGQDPKAPPGMMNMEFEILGLSRRRAARHARRQDVQPMRLEVQKRGQGPRRARAQLFVGARAISQRDRPPRRLRSEARSEEEANYETVQDCKDSSRAAPSSAFTPIALVTKVSWPSALGSDGDRKQASPGSAETAERHHSDGEDRYRDARDTKHVSMFSSLTRNIHHVEIMPSASEM